MQVCFAYRLLAVFFFLNAIPQMLANYADNFTRTEDYKRYIPSLSFMDLTPNQALWVMIMGQCQDENGVKMNDGLICLKYAASKPNEDADGSVAYVACPTIAPQSTNKLVRIQWKDEKWNELVKVDYSQCGNKEAFASLTDEEKLDLLEITKELQEMQHVCKGMDAGEHMFIELTHMQYDHPGDPVGERRPKYTFDNVACQFEGYTTTCPLDSKYFNMPDYTHFTYGNYTGIDCIKGEYLQLLRKIGADKYLTPGCSEVAVPGYDVALPQSAPGEVVEIPCSVIMKMFLPQQHSKDDAERIAEAFATNEKIQVTCSHFSEWHIPTNRDYYKKCFKREIFDVPTGEDGCPREHLNGVQWYSSSKGSVDRNSCPDKMFGFEIDKTNSPQATRKCNDEGKWEAPSLKECIDALPDFARRVIDGVKHTFRDD